MVVMNFIYYVVKLVDRGIKIIIIGGVVKYLIDVSIG